MCVEECCLGWRRSGIVAAAQVMSSTHPTDGGNPTSPSDVVVKAEARDSFPGPSEKMTGLNLGVGLSAASGASGGSPGVRDAGAAAVALKPRRLDRTKSWGSAQIDKLNKERESEEKQVQASIAHVPFFSKLGYLMHFGEPIPDDNIHLDDDAWVAKMLSRDNWWVIHPFSSFRRYWDVFLMTLMLYIALMVPFVISFEVRGCFGSQNRVKKIPRRGKPFGIVFIFCGCFLSCLLPPALSRRLPSSPRGARSVKRRSTRHRRPRQLHTRLLATTR